MVFDQWDPAADFYLQEKQETEKDYQEFRLEMLQQRLGKFLTRLRDRTDLNFGSYIRAQTGYEMDIFEGFRRDVDTIISKGKIENATSAGNHVIVQIKAPSPDYESTLMTGLDSTSRIISEAEYATFRYNDGLLSECDSPDGLRQIMTRTNGTEENALTEVSIILKGGSGCIYCARGLSLPIKASWKDNSTIVIETQKEYPVEIKHHTVRSFQDVVKIEYLEH